jgi:multidrug efflux pump
MDDDRSVTVIIFRQPGANIICTVQRIRDQLSFLQAVMPKGIDFTIVLDRTTTIRASVRDVDVTLIICRFRSPRSRTSSTRASLLQSPS